MADTDHAEFESSSSNIAKVAWHRQDNGVPTDVLTVTFRNGRVYRYYDVPEDVYAALYAAETTGGSTGRTFNELVRNADFGAEEITGQ